MKKIKRLRPLLFAAIVIAAALGVGLAGQQPSSNSFRPRFLADNELSRPDNYREWVWLSSGLGMTYGPLADAAGSRDPRFDNVLATP